MPALKVAAVEKELIELLAPLAAEEKKDLRGRGEKNHEIIRVGDFNLPPGCVIVSQEEEVRVGGSLGRRRKEPCR